MKRIPNFPATLIGCASLFLAAAAGAQERCPEISRLAEAAVPSRLEDPNFVANLLQPKAAATPLSRAFSFDKARQAVRDDRLTEGSQPSHRPDRGHESEPSGADGERIFRGAEGTVLRADPAHGKIVYLNRQRSRGGRQGKASDVTREQAIEATFRAAEALGVSVSELDRRNLETRVLMGSGRDKDRREAPFRFQAEIHVRVPRQVSGIPVFDSFLHTSIATSSEIARLHLQWPDFALVPGLSAENALRRRQVVEQLREALTDADRCPKISSLKAEVAYVQADQLAISTTQGDEGDKQPTGVDRLFVPALVVYAVPPEPKEDSGEIAMGAQQLVIPLFRGAGDRRERK